MGGEMGTNAGEFLGSRRVSPSMVSSFEPLGRSSVVVPTRVSSDAHRRPPRRVVPSPAPRVTPQDPPRGQHEAFSGAELAERGHAVLRARRDEPAARRRERGDVGAVKLDEGEGDARQGIGILRGGRRVVVAGGLVGFGGIGGFGGFVGAGASPSGRVRVGRVFARASRRGRRARAGAPAARERRERPAASRERLRLARDAPRARARRGGGSSGVASARGAGRRRRRDGGGHRRRRDARRRRVRARASRGPGRHCRGAREERVAGHPRVAVHVEPELEMCGRV